MTYGPQGTPEIKEHYIDSKKDVDRHLKFSCEQFIQQQTRIFVGNMEEFLTKVASMSDSRGGVVTASGPDCTNLTFGFLSLSLHFCQNFCTDPLTVAMSCF